MNILIVFATNSGGTQLVSEHITDLLLQQNHQVTTKNVREVNPLDLNQFDIIFLGSCTWNDQHVEGQLQREFQTFITKTQDVMYEGKKFVVFALGDTSYTYFAKAADHLVEFIASKKGILVGVPLKIDGYMFKKDYHNKIINVWVQTLGL